MHSPTLCPDVAVLGGGAAGLWALARLRAQGHSVLLFSAGALGDGQSVLAQGILHAGVKYALAGDDGAERSLAAMPAAWRDCLAGRGAVDLRACRLLSEHMYLFAPPGPAGRLRGAAAGALLRGRVQRLGTAQVPPALRTAGFRSALYRLDEAVLDVGSLLQALASPHRQHIYHLPAKGARLQRRDGLAQLQLPGCRVRPRLLLLAAGAGNADLLAQLGDRETAMQRRPLQQVVLDPGIDLPLYGHCLGSGRRPRFTVTSHRDAAGRTLWYLGGELAERGAQMSPAQLQLHARAELDEVFPGLQPDPARLRCVPAQRAEARQRDGARPAGAYLEAVHGVANALVAWPTKLALCPDLGERLARALRRRGIAPGPQPDPAPLRTLEQPQIARPPWERTA